MPRPTRPQNYASVWGELCETFMTTEKDLEFQVASKKQAINVRISFHAYRKALRMESERILKQNKSHTPRSLQMADEAMQAGNRTVLIQSAVERGMAYKDIPMDNHPCVVVFKIRDHLEMEMAIAQQLREFLVENDVTPYKKAEEKADVVDGMVETAPVLENLVDKYRGA